MFLTELKMSSYCMSFLKNVYEFPQELAWSLKYLLVTVNIISGWLLNVCGDKGILRTEWLVQRGKEV